MMQTQDTAEKTAPANQSVFMHGRRASGGIDYSKETEITQDEMTDELFAAMKRGDDDMVLGITSGVGRRAHASLGAGVALLTSQAQETKFKQSRSRSRSSRFSRNPFAEGGLMAALLAETNGNEELAALLLARLKANTLMSMDGVYADEIAREMGVHGLSETLRQSQREETDRVNAATEAENKTSIWSSWFGSKAASDIVITPIVPEEQNPGVISKFGRSISKMFCKLSGRQAAEPEEKPAPALALAFAGPRFALHGPRMF